MLGILIGEVTAYNRKSGLATVRLRGRLLSGDHVHIVGPTTDCEVSTPVVDVAPPIEDAWEVQDVNLPLPPVCRGDLVFRLIGNPTPVAA